MSQLVIAASLVVLLLAVELRAAPTPASPVWPESPLYVIAPAGKVADEHGAGETIAPGWQAIEPMGGFFSRGASEPSESGTTARMCHAEGTLHVAVECRAAAGESPESADRPGAPKDAVTFYYTETAEAAFPFGEIRVTPDGAVTVTRYTRPFPRWNYFYPAEPIDPAGIGVHVGRSGEGWWVELSIPMTGYGIPGGSFYANVVRGEPSEGALFGWSDTTGVSVNSPHHFGRMKFSEAVVPAQPRVLLPATLAVGVNRIRLANWRKGLRLEANSAVIPVAADGSAVVEVRERGRVRLQILGGAGEELSRYRADVRAPLEVEAGAARPGEGRGLSIDINTVTAGAEGFDVTLEAIQGGKLADTMTFPHSGPKSQVGWTLRNCVPGDVTIRAKADIPTMSGESVRVEATSTCAYVEGLEGFDKFREGIDSLPTRALYRAALADACNYYRLTQAGDGRYRTVGRDGKFEPSEWYYCFVYAMALIYKSDWPENPYFGDRRFLESAVAGMEAGLDPTGAYFAGGYSRHLQAYLLTYELLKDDIEPERAAYWRQRCAEIVEHTLESHLDAGRNITSFYSFDCGTGTNHFAYYVANLYAAGRVLERPEWLALGQELMLRLSRHEADGQFAERRGMPATHYTWLTMNALGEYWAQSGDESVRPILERCAEFSCQTSLSNNDIMLLHDGRNNTYHPYDYGDFVLGLTPHGRYLARRRLLDHAGASKRPGESSPEYWFRVAENALYFEDGPAEPLPDEGEFPFLDGRALVARKAGFLYGLSAISLPATTEQFWLDPQSAVELHHATAGPILHGANSITQPEAGSFMRRVGDRVIFLPTEGRVERTDKGHAARLEFDGFGAEVSVQVLSETEAEVRVELLKADGEEPVTYSFFPAVSGAAPAVSADGMRLDCGRFSIESNLPVTVERGFLITSPYSEKREVDTKPARASVTLEKYRPLVLTISVAP